MRLAPWLGLIVVLGVVALSGGVRAGQIPSRSWLGLESTLLDTWFNLRGVVPSQDAVVLVEVDDAALEAYPMLVERRTGIAKLLKALEASNASATAVDLLLSDPERLIPEPLATEVHDWVMEPEAETPQRARDLLVRIEEVSQGDPRLEAVMRTQEVILAFHIGTRGEPLKDQRLSRGTYGQVVPGGRLPESHDRVLMSLPRFNRVAEALGFISVRELAGQVRSAPLVLRAGPRHFAPLGVQMAAHHLGIPRGKRVYLGDADQVKLGDRVLQGDNHQLWLNWRGPGAIERVSAKEVLEGTVDLRGRIALVAYTYLSQDTIQTPWGPVPGGLVHATVMDNVLAGDPMRRATVGMELLHILLAGGLVVLGFFIPGGRIARFGWTALGGAVAIGAPAVAFFSGPVWMGSVGALLAVGASALVCFSTAWLQEGAQARALRKAFSHYISEDLLAVMVADPSLVQLRGQRRTLSVVFSDIRDFTTYSERLEPLELIGFLNHYLTPMTRAVLDNRGFVDKFIGDAVMALFGAPVRDPDHAVNACRSALDMYVALDEVRPEALRHGIELAIGVGVNSGEVAVGNMGSQDRFEYTVLGDAVNLASRLEGLTKTYGVFCLIGSTTAGLLTTEFVLRPLDLVRVKGKTEPVEIFELCGDGRVTISTYRAARSS